MKKHLLKEKGRGKRKGKGEKETRIRVQDSAVCFDACVFIEEKK